MCAKKGKKKGGDSVSFFISRSVPAYPLPHQYFTCCHCLVFSILIHVQGYLTVTELGFPSEKAVEYPVYFSEHFFDTAFEFFKLSSLDFFIECCEFLLYSGYKPFIRSVQFNLVIQSSDSL